MQKLRCSCLIHPKVSRITRSVRTPSDHVTRLDHDTSMEVGDLDRTGSSIHVHRVRGKET